MSVANQYEQQMLDLINADRAEAGLNPLVFNGDLNESSEDHSAWMLETDSFSHRGEGGSSSRNRIEDAGYELTGRWLTGENIAWVSEEGDNGLSDEVVRLHTNLMNSPGHRAKLLNPDFKEIGIGIEEGDFVDGGQNIDAVFVTQNFGTTSANTVVLPSVEETGVLSEGVPTLPVEPASDTLTPIETPEIQAGAGTQSFDFSQFLASIDGAGSTLSDEDAADDFSSTTQTSTSSVDVTSVASEANGPSVDIVGEGNFSGGGVATVEGVTEEENASASISPAEISESQSDQPFVADEQSLENTMAFSTPPNTPFDFESFMLSFGSDAQIRSATSTSSIEVTSIASEANGPSVDIEGEGTFAGGGAALANETTAEDFLASIRSDMDSFQFNFDSNPAIDSGTSVSSAAVRSVASVENGVEVDIIEMQGNFGFRGFAGFEGTVQNVLEGSSADALINLAGMFDSPSFEDFLF